MSTNPIKKTVRDLADSILKEGNRILNLAYNSRVGADPLTIALQNIKSLVDTLDNSTFSDVVSKELLALKSTIDVRLSTLPSKLFDDLGKFDKTGLNSFLKTKFISMNDMAKSTLNTIKNEMLSNISLGVDKEKVLINIAKKVEGRLIPYSETLYNTAKQEFNQRVELDVIKQLKLDEDKDILYYYSGPPLKDNSHEACRAAFAFGRYFTYQEMQDFITKWGIRYNCRHLFAVTDKRVGDF